MREEIPKWLSEKMNNYLDSCDNMSGSFLTRHLIEIRQKAFLECFEFLSKPENAAKLEYVKTLIEAAQQTRQDIDTILKVRTEITIAMAEGHINDLDDALKPFKKEGE